LLAAEAVEDQPDWIWFMRGSLGRTKIKSPERGNGRRDKRHLIIRMPRAGRKIVSYVTIVKEGKSLNLPETHCAIP
jgi:hypothetical protein